MGFWGSEDLLGSSKALFLILFGDSSCTKGGSTREELTEVESKLVETWRVPPITVDGDIFPSFLGSRSDPLFLTWD